MTNREMAIRFAAKVLEQVVSGDTSNAAEALEILKAEVEVFDLLNQILESK